MNDLRVHAFGDDALGELDAVAVAELVRSRDLSPAEVLAAAVARAHAVDPALRAVAFPSYGQVRVGDDAGALYGVPTFVKDNTDVRGMPSNHGSEALVGALAKRDGAFTTQYLSTGMTVLGKSRLPEFGFNASTEYMTQEPVRNPWDTRHSVGASSGGSAALVASGVVPIAHANDGGGSIRIPAANAGLVGLKSSRGRLVDGELARRLPINLAVEGVLTRTVRDTAAFVAAAEDHWRNPGLPPIGLVRGPSRRTLRVGLVVDSITGVPDAETRATVEHTASLLEKAGHVVEPVALPVGEQFAADFLQYWSLLAELAADFGRVTFGPSFDATRLDGLTVGLRRHHRRTAWRTPGALLRLRRVKDGYAQLFARHELVLSPVLAHPAPLLGRLSPTVPYDELVERLRHYVAYTPLNNIAGTPAISLPMGCSATGLPIGVQLSAAYGDERTLLETAFGLEEQQPFRRIQDH